MHLYLFRRKMTDWFQFLRIVIATLIGILFGYVKNAFKNDPELWDNGKALRTLIIGVLYALLATSVELFGLELDVNVWIEIFFVQTGIVAIIERYAQAIWRIINNWFTPPPELTP